MNSKTKTLTSNQKVDATGNIFSTANSLIVNYRSVRNFSREICKTLEHEDFVIQSMPDVSPTKWHLAHTTWFFETFILSEFQKDYKPFNPLFKYLFNSYYVQVGERFPRPQRGLLSRPTVSEVFEYRNYVDQKMAELLENTDEKTLNEIKKVFEIGINHEQQHQELMLTDIKHVLSLNPLRIQFSNGENIIVKSVPELNWISFDEGIYETGFGGEDFAFDNEFPRHKVYLNSFEIANRLITNGEYLEFINAGGYKKQELWLSDGWYTKERENWEAPLYWEKQNGEWFNFTLNGFREINLAEPVTHISHYEADAFARWKGARLATEAEWEIAAGTVNIEGNFVESGNFHPVPLHENHIKNEIHQMFGDVWEWTSSPYVEYPGFKTLEGALGEYNGKFMSNQMVLRGGSCATSLWHIRKTYRNFFPSYARWQFSGIRLARIKI